jgi:hypothetical protein
MSPFSFLIILNRKLTVYEERVISTVAELFFDLES